jgi:hypothetical protein
MSVASQEERRRFSRGDLRSASGCVASVSLVGIRLSVQGIARVGLIPRPFDPDQLAGTMIRARATRPHGTVTLIHGMRTLRETLSGGSLGLFGALNQVTSKVQRAMPRDFVQVSTFAGWSGTGSSEGPLEAGPNIATIDDGRISMIFAGQETVASTSKRPP